MLTTGESTWRMPRLRGLARDRRRDPLDQRRVPGRRQRDRLRKHRRAVAREPVQRLFERDDRECRAASSRRSSAGSR